MLLWWQEKEKVGSACRAAINVPPSSTVAPLFQTLMPHPFPKLIQVIHFHALFNVLCVTVWLWDSTTAPNMVSAFVALMLFTCVLLNGLLFVVISLFWWLRLLWQVLYWWLRLICRTGQRNKSGYVLYQSRFVCFCGSSNVLYHRPSEEVSLSSLTICMLVYYQSQTFVSLCIKCHVFLCIMSHRSGVVFVVLLSKSLCVCCFLVSLSLKYYLVLNNSCAIFSFVRSSPSHILLCLIQIQNIYLYLKKFQSCKQVFFRNP